MELPDRSKFEFTKDNSTFHILCEQIRALRLHNYPFGDGDWRSPDRFESDCPDLETVTQLGQVAALDKIYHYDGSWSSDIEQLRKAAIDRPAEIDIKAVLGAFTNLRFTSPQLKAIDPMMRNLFNLHSLSFLATTKLDHIAFDNLPPHLRQLNVIGCGLSGLNESLEQCSSFPYVGLIHLGLAMNQCRSTFTDHYLNASFFPNLRSIDLSSNQLTNLSSFVKCASSLVHLGAVNMTGNPLCYYKHYRVALIDRLGVTMLDDLEVSVEEKERAKLAHAELIESSSSSRSKRRNVLIHKSAGEVNVDYNLAELKLTIESVTGLDKQEYNGDIRVELDTGVWPIVGSDLKPVDAAVIVNFNSLIEINEHTIDELGSFTTKLSIFFRVAAKPAKAAKKAKKGAKGKTPEPSAPPTPLPDELILESELKLRLDGKTQSILVRGEQLPPDYAPPSMTSASATPSGKGKKGKKGSSEGAGVETPVVINVNAQIIVLS